jgi:hypothetical protein
MSMLDQREKRRTFENDLSLRNKSAQSEASTFQNFAQSEANVARGRFTAELAQTVVGTEPLPRYPQLPSSSPWSGLGPDPGQEPPLGYSTDRMSRPAPVEAEPNPANAPSDPLDVERAGLGLSSGRPASGCTPTSGASLSQMGDAGAGRSQRFHRRY